MTTAIWTFVIVVYAATFIEGATRGMSRAEIEADRARREADREARWQQELKMREEREAERAEYRKRHPFIPG